MKLINNKTPLDLLENCEVAKICAPMVRYSRHPFRLLVRKYGAELAYTPMILSDCFVKSQKARDVDFTTAEGDRPLIVQFAANDAITLAAATEYIYSESDGVDINCGCPQRWAIKERIGSYLIDYPELVRDMVHQVRQRFSRNDFTVSVKIRIHDDIRRTVDLCQMVERAGVSFLTVHARTRQQRSEPINTDAIRTIVDSLSVPVVANGDIKRFEDVQRLAEMTGAKGVMAAQAILNNPTLYSGSAYTTRQCVKDWLDISSKHDVSFMNFHHHLVFMLEKVLPKPERKIFNVLQDRESIVDYLTSSFDMPYWDKVG